ncbi:hypothetical protein B7494_g4874 [Chlorociboria aeruginascens]|nr:hypothetical protein B7494_g4874 [Chlorociboria aeruginascens]
MLQLSHFCNTYSQTNVDIPGVDLADENMELRGQKAVTELKPEIKDGDIIAYVKDAGDKSRLVDCFGVKINEFPRLHSQSVVAARIPRISLQLNAPGQKRAKKLLGLSETALPEGVSFVVNLVPDTEGEAALEALHKLSCPLGILYWASSSVRIDVASRLVGGQDNMILKPGSADNFASSPELAAFQKSRKEMMEMQKRAPEFISHTLDESNVSPSGNSQQNDSNTIKIPIGDDYSQARHRSTILKLLQLIEGVDIALDSAPMVWTLTFLAQTFKCTHLVLDLVVSWMTADPNSHIIELLPECSWKIGKALGNELIGKPAWTILVGDEALSIASRIHLQKQNDANPNIQKAFGLPKTNADMAGKNQFGRLKDPIDEDSLTSIQYAAQAFHDRVQAQFDKLVSGVPGWLTNILELEKCEAVLKHGEVKGPHNNHVKDYVDKFKVELIDFIRVRILKCFIDGLTPFEIEIADGRRAMEQYLEPYEGSFQNLYYGLSIRERVMLRYPWQKLFDIVLSTDCTSKGSYTHDEDSVSFAWDRVIGARGGNGIMGFQIRPVTMLSLVNLTNQLNEEIMVAVRSHGFNDGNLGEDTTEEHMTKISDLYLDAPDDPAFEMSQYSIARTSGATGDSARGQDSSTTNRGATTLPIRRRTSQNEGNHESTSRDIPLAAALGKMGPSTNSVEPLPMPCVPDDSHIGPDSPFINLTELLKQVVIYIQGISREMLDYGPLGEYHNYTDTLSCLKDELRYLLLSCGGFDDETGIAFSEDVPPANTFVAPNAPGPFFTTGYSAVSEASTDHAISDTDYSVINGSNAGGSITGDSVIVSRDQGGISSYADSTSLRVDKGTTIMSEGGIQSEPFSLGEGDFLDTAMPDPESKSESSFDLITDSDAETERGAQQEDSENGGSPPEENWEFDEENEEEAFDYGDEPMPVVLD